MWENPVSGKESNDFMLNLVFSLSTKFTRLFFKGYYYFIREAVPSKLSYVGILAGETAEDRLTAVCILFL